MCETVYDKDAKIWKGPNYQQYFDRNCSIGRIAFEEMFIKSKDICQISDTEKTSLTFGEVRLQAIRIARHFEMLGIKQSDIVGIVGRNTTYVMALIVACFFHGSTYHAINPNLDKQTSKQLFNITKPKIIFCDGQELEKVRFASNDFETTIYTLKNHVDGVAQIMELMQSTGNEEEYEPAELERGPEQTAAILSSSGTSGLPKAVTIPHCSRILTRAFYLNNTDVCFATTMMDMLSGFFFLLASITRGIKRVIMDLPIYNPKPEYLAEMIEKYQITVVHVTPLIMVALTKHSKILPQQFDSIRHFIYSGYKSNRTIEQNMQKLLRNGRIVHCYGITEFNGGISLNFNLEEKPESFGKLLRGVQVCIVDENGKKLGPNETGEIWCRHDEFWGGYFNNTEATKEIYDEDGWFRTGDLGYVDQDNCLYMVDRLKDVLRYKGIMYYPSEIESRIAQIPEVKDVCVFGIESELDGDEAAAAVVLVDGSQLNADDIMQFVQQKEEAWFKHLHGGCQIFNELPKTANLKVHRRATKSLFLKNKVYSKMNGNK